MPSRSGLWWSVVVGVVVLVAAATAVAATVAWELRAPETELDGDRDADAGDPGASGKRVGEPSDADQQAPAPEEADDAGNLVVDGPVPGVHEALEELTVVLILGSDAREAVGGARADVVMLALVPRDRDEPPLLVSLPRDLWVANPCTGGRTRINAGLAGCGEQTSGPQLMQRMVEGATGVSIDHHAVIDFTDFETAVDAVGGVEICVDRPTRDTGGAIAFELPAGCSTVDGDTALGWVRSRSTQHRVDGQWRRMPGVSDLTRNERQRDLLVQVLVEGGRGPMIERLAFAEDMLDRTTASQELRLPTLVRLGWRLRDVPTGEVAQVELPVTGHVTSGGAQVLLPTRAFAEVVADHRPGLLD